MIIHHKTSVVVIARKSITKQELKNEGHYYDTFLWK
jgi:hypothetical protein